MGVTEVKYYLHDSNSINDEKVTLLYMKFGYEGVGLFYVILEKLAQQEKPIQEIVLISQLNIRKRLKKVLQFIYEIELLLVKNGEVFSETLLNFSEKYEIKKEKTRKRVAEWRERQADKENVTGYVPVSNTPKVKLSKVKENKVKDKEVFNEFKELFPGIKRKNETEFNNFTKKHKDWKDVLPLLLPAVKEQIEYRAKAPTDLFIPEWKMLQTWINQRSWEDVMPKIKSDNDWIDGKLEKLKNN